MQQLAGFPYFEVQFTREGRVHDRAEADALLDFVGQGGVTDLFVLAHGWNNDMADARALYAKGPSRINFPFWSGRPGRSAERGLA